MTNIKGKQKATKSSLTIFFSCLVNTEERRKKKVLKAHKTRKKKKENMSNYFGKLFPYSSFLRMLGRAEH
jgi:hypothetical protein